ncbi:MAG: CHAD domain-containing protein [Planctomycetota bacterium]
MDAVTAKSKKDVERVHQLRTETRRADAALRLFADWLPRRRADWIRRRLGDVRCKAGTVRDLDVLMLPLEELGRQLPKQAGKWLLDRAELFRAEAMHSLRRFCRQLLKHGFEDRTRSLTDRIGWRHASAEPSPSELGSLAIGRLATDFFCRVDLLRDDRQQLHKVRILGRRLRYTLDLLRDVLPAFPAEAACRELSEIQESLGLANDQATALQFLQSSAAECGRKPVTEPLRRAIDSLKITMAEQVELVIHEVTGKVDRVRSFVAELTR